MIRRPAPAGAGRGPAVARDAGASPGLAATALADRLRYIDLVVFDKDGTLIDFHGMWGGWAIRLGERLGTETGRTVGSAIRAALGVSEAGDVQPHGPLAATPMARLRQLTVDVLVAEGIRPPLAERAVAVAWQAPDPVALAVPLADLTALLGGLRASGRHVAIATSDDREPTERTLAALGIDGLVEVVVCADDGIATKPAPDAVLEICRRLGVVPARTAVVGDARADLEMGRAAGVAVVLGVASGVAPAAELAALADIVLPSVAALLPAAGLPAGR